MDFKGKKIPDSLFIPYLYPMKKIHWLWFVVAGIGLQLAYLPTRPAGFVTDFTGLAERIETHGAGGILSSFDFPALQPVTSIFYYLLYHHAPIAGWGWYLSTTLLHTANAIFLFFLVRRLLAGTDSFSRLTVPAFGALLVLFHPYATEVVVWRVGFHYLLVTFWALAILWQTQNWLESRKSLHWWGVILLQFIALLTYELAIIIPFIGMALMLWQDSSLQIRKAIIRLSLPQLSLVALYFLANRLFLGSWIGHYGSEVHLNFPLTEMIANTGRYFFKWVGFSRYWPHAWKESLALGLAGPVGTILLLTLLLGLLLWMLKSFRRADRKTQFIWIFGTAALLALLPILNLYFNYLLHIENDRYGYLPALFFYPAFMALLSFLPRWLFLSLVTTYFFCSLWFLQRTNQYWAQSTTVYRGLLADFDAYDRDTCYLLNLPDNLQGAPMFRDFSGKDRAFADALRYVQHKPYSGVLEEVVQYNMVLPTDGVQVESDSSGLKVTFNQWGNWWWRRGIGASSYRDSTYIFHNEGHHYRLEWRKKPENAKVLFQAGKRWRNWEEQ